MSDEWVQQFRQFALAVDYVDESIIDDIKELLQQFFEETLETCYFRFLTEGAGTETPDGVLPTLETVWSSSAEKTGDVALFPSGGRASGHLALCYQLRKPLWITAQGGKLLVAADTELIDGWSRVKNLPPYHDHGESNSRTSIVVPLRYGGHLYGVMDLEFSDHVLPSTKAKQVIKAIADAVSRIIWLNRMTNSQRDDTREAFAAVQRSYRRGTSPLQRNTVFVASSGGADDEVMTTILSVLAEFQHLFDVSYWRAESSSGGVADQVRAAIGDSAFGVCYISEPSTDEESSYKFLDNPNVLFEAGMLQMLHELRDDRSDLISRWVPVREGPDIAPPLPFDFAGERVIVVPREGGVGAVDKAIFAEMLRTTLKAVVDDLHID